MINRLCVIGVGLIGGSLAAALKERKQVGEIVGYSRRAETLETARYLGLIDRGETDLAEAIAGADIIVIAIPVGQYRSLFEMLSPIWPTQAVVTDCGSTKGSVHADLRAVMGKLPSNFIAGHPVAGTERSGPAAAQPDLYRHRRVVLTPHAEADPPALEQIIHMWESVGASVSQMNDVHHDEVLALTSHLPHVIAYQLIATLAASGDAEEVFSYAAGGLRDLTRIASSDPDMWRDIIRCNAGAVTAALDRYIADLQNARAEIAAQDGEAMRARYSRARETRDNWIRMAEAD